MSSPMVSKWQHWSYIFLMVVLSITGMGQMPIFKRYYITMVPGLSWLGDFYTTHMVHYIAAGLLMALVAYFTVSFIRSWRFAMRLTLLGSARAVVLALLIATGIVRVLKNRPDVFFSPGMVMFIDFAHLGLAILLGILALAALVKRSTNYCTRV